MAVGSGLVAQLGVAPEVTPGTRVAPNRHFEFLSEGIKNNQQWINSAGLRPGRVTNRRYAAGTAEVSGPVDLEVSPEGFGILLKHAMGAVQTTGTDPYTHVFTPGTLNDKTLSLQIGKPDETGTVHPFDYTGCSITSWSLTAAVNDFLKAQFQFYAMSESVAESLTTPTYPATLTPFAFIDGSLTIDGSGSCVKSFNFTADNALATGRHQICATPSRFPKQAKEQGIRQYGGTMTADFSSLALYNKFLAGTLATLALVFASGDNSLTLDLQVRYNGETPSVTGPTILEQTVPFTCFDADADADAVTITLVNGDTAP